MEHIPCLTAQPIGDAIGVGHFLGDFQHLGTIPHDRPQTGVPLQIRDRVQPWSAADIEEGYACYGTEDFRIGYRAFLDKVKPEFKGK